MAAFGWECKGSLGPAHAVDGESDFIKVLLNAYETYTGRKGYCEAIGGGTYVHEIPGGVAFGQESMTLTPICMEQTNGQESPAVEDGYDLCPGNQQALRLIPLADLSKFAAANDFRCRKTRGSVFTKCGQLSMARTAKKDSTFL